VLGVALFVWVAFWMVGISLYTSRVLMYTKATLDFQEIRLICTTIPLSRMPSTLANVQHALAVLIVTIRHRGQCTD
jgi:hypothetical protein